MAPPIDGFVFDLDGTVYLGESALPGASDGIAKLCHRRRRILFVSNRPLEPRQAYAAKLTRFGIPTELNEVITSGYLLGHCLALTSPQLRYDVIGEGNLRTELRGHSLTIAEELLPQDTQEVVVPDGY